jgi:hypothetical protein
MNGTSAARFSPLRVIAQMGSGISKYLIDVSHLQCRLRQKGGSRSIAKTQRSHIESKTAEMMPKSSKLFNSHFAPYRIFPPNK